MRGALLVIVLTALSVLAGGPPPLPGRTCPLTTRNQLLDCVNVMDGNDDGTITESEVDDFMAQHTSCIAAPVRAALTGAAVVAACDTDSSGNLTAVDWDAPTGCFQLRSRQLSLCRACERCGLLVTKKKRAAAAAAAVHDINAPPLVHSVLQQNKKQ